MTAPVATTTFTNVMPVFAEDVLIVNGECEGSTTYLVAGHTFKAYQIFKGTNTGLDNVLGQIEWADIFNKTTFITEFTGLANDASARTVAEEIAKYLENSSIAQKVAEAAYKASVNDTEESHYITLQADASDPAKYTGEITSRGYYLIIDTTEAGTDKIVNKAVLQVYGDKIEVKVKVDKPSLTKEIVEGSTSTSQNTAAIGDTVEYVLKSKVPATISQYKDVIG